MNAYLIQFAKSSVCLNPVGGSIIKSEFRDRCFIYQSFYLEKTPHGDGMITPLVSFLADSGDGHAAEWEPRYGPIQIRHECDAKWTSEDGFKPQKHWHFPLIKGEPLSWSQLAVDDEDLKGKLGRGDVDGVFDVLMRWANRE